MPLKNYGVLKGWAIDRKLGAGSSPHYQVLVMDDTTDYRIAINVKSKKHPSELLYIVEEDLQHPILDLIGDLPPGFAPLPTPWLGSAPSPEQRMCQFSSKIPCFHFVSKGSL